MRHELKTINPHFQYLWDNLKTFEIRKNDRNFQVGDILILNEYQALGVPRYVEARITHLLKSEDFPEGIKDGYCVLSIDVVIAGFQEQRS